MFDSVPLQVLLASTIFVSPFVIVPLYVKAGCGRFGRSAVDQRATPLL